MVQRKSVPYIKFIFDIAVVALSFMMIFPSPLLFVTSTDNIISETYVHGCCSDTTMTKCQNSDTIDLYVPDNVCLGCNDENTPDTIRSNKPIETVSNYEFHTLEHDLHMPGVSATSANSVPNHNDDGTRLIRRLRPDELETAKQIILDSGLPKELLDELIKDFHNVDMIGETWFLTEVNTDGQLMSVAFVRSELQTFDVYNVIILAVSPRYQRQGCGRRMMIYLEDMLIRDENARQIMVETSGRDEYAGARHLYTSLQYQEIGRFQDYYEVGEDKVIYMKLLRTI